MQSKCDIVGGGIKLNIHEKLQFMKEQQVLGAIELKDSQQFIATVDDITQDQVAFLEHSPNEIDPLIIASVQQIANIKIPQPYCDEETNL